MNVGHASRAINEDGHLVVMVFASNAALQLVVFISVLISCASFLAGKAACLGAPEDLV